MSDNSKLDELLRRHVERNHELVNVLVRRGVDFDVPRLIEHHFWAEGHRNAVTLAKELFSRGFLILVLARVTTGDESRDLWNVEAEAQQSITVTVNNDTALELIEIADRLNCIYDGWGTRV
jgi:regulator of RNase E activity RraB